MQVLASKKEIKKGDYTYNLMTCKNSEHVHINNHKTNDKSIIVPVSAIKELLSGE